MTVLLAHLQMHVLSELNKHRPFTVLISIGDFVNAGVKLNLKKTEVPRKDNKCGRKPT